MNRTILKTLLVKHECVGGKIPLKPYPDTVGKLTIGVGRNLTDDGISADEAQLMLDNDIHECVARLPSICRSFGSLDDTRQHVLIDMAFNLGIDGLRKFQKLLACVEARDFTGAAREMLDSAWAKEVGDRANELAAMMSGAN